MGADFCVSTGGRLPDEPGYKARPNPGHDCFDHNSNKSLKNILKIFITFEFKSKFSARNCGMDHRGMSVV